MPAGEPSFKNLPKEVVIRRALIAAIVLVVFMILLVGLRAQPTNESPKWAREKQARYRVYWSDQLNKAKVEYWNESQSRWMFLNVYNKLEQANGLVDTLLSQEREKDKKKELWRIVREEY